MPLVKNNAQSQRSLYFPKGSGYAHVDIAKNGGMAEVPADAWKSIKDRPVVLAWLADSTIEVVNGSKTSKPKPEVSDAPDEEVELPLSLLSSNQDILDQLAAAGLTVKKIARAKPEHLTGFKYIGEATANHMIESAIAALRS